MSSSDSETSAESLNYDASSNEVGNLKGEKSQVELESPDLIEYLVRLLYWKYFRLVIFALVIISDIYLFWTYGVQTMISALAAEGTLSLALVTYLQMRSSQQRSQP